MGVVYLAARSRRSSGPSRSRRCARWRRRAARRAPSSRRGSSRRRSSPAGSSTPTSSPSTRSAARARPRFIAMEYVDGEPLDRAASSDAGASPLRRGSRSSGRSPGPRARARARRAPPRHQAGQHPRRARRAREGHGLRDRKAHWRAARRRPDAHGPDDREARRTCRPSRSRERSSTAARTSSRWASSLYELLTGARPFPGESITTLVYQILHTEPRDPLELRRDLPPVARRGLRAAARQAARPASGGRGGFSEGDPKDRGGAS